MSNILFIDRYRKVHIPRDALVRVEKLKDGRLHVSVSAQDAGVICEESNLPKWFRLYLQDLKERLSYDDSSVVHTHYGTRIDDDLFYITCESC